MLVGENEKQLTLERGRERERERERERGREGERERERERGGEKREMLTLGSRGGTLRTLSHTR